MTSAITTISVNEIRETFYNSLLNIATDTEWATIDNIEGNSNVSIALIALTLLDVLERSKHYKENIFLLCNKMVNLGNCPPDFKPLFDHILELKKITDPMNDEKYKQVQNDCLRQLDLLMGLQMNPIVYKIAGIIVSIAKEVYGMGPFKSMIHSLVQFYKSMNVSSSNNARTQEPITESLVQLSFYNLMVTEVVESKLIRRDALEGGDSHIFLDLSAFTLVAACVLSKDVSGILMLNGSILTLNNCPEIYKELAQIILQVKNKIKNLSEEQIYTLKTICSTDPELECEEGMQTAELTSMATFINSVSIEVSKRETFKLLMMKVIDFCIGALG